MYCKSEVSCCPWVVEYELVVSQPTQASNTWPLDVVLYADSSQTIMSFVVDPSTLPHCVSHGEPFATSSAADERQRAAKSKARDMFITAP